MSYLTTNVLSHTQRVRRLYKGALRTIKSYYFFPHLIRYEAVLLRARFDEKQDIDMVSAKKLLKDGEEELFQRAHPQPFKFANSPGGSAYGREPHMPDWLLDMWHPLERLQYPVYFARREQRKREYIERWEKKYGKAQPDAH